MERGPTGLPRAPINHLHGRSQWVRPGYQVPTTRPVAQFQARKEPSSPSGSDLDRLPGNRLGQNAQEISTVKLHASIQDPDEKAAGGEADQQEDSKQELGRGNRSADGWELPDKPAELQQLQAGIDTGPEYYSETHTESDVDDDFSEEEINSRFEADSARLERKKANLHAIWLRPSVILNEILQLDRIAAMDLSFLDEALSQPGLIQSVEEAPSKLLTPKAEEFDNGNVIPDRGGEILKPVELRRKETPPMESLPYLRDGPPTPVSDVLQDNADRPKDISEILRCRLSVQQEADTEEQQNLELQYASLYRVWRETTRRIDKERKAEEEGRNQAVAENEPAMAPEPAIMSMLGSLPENGSRRAHKFSSEYVLQMVLDATKETDDIAKQSKKVPEAAAKADPDYEKEARIPTQLSSKEKQTRIFKDYSGLVDADDTVIDFELDPLKDDFTQEEHGIMLQNNKEYPKKWGKIAQALPGRTYKDCINHYYATKWDGVYKEKKGRAGRRTGRGRALKNASLLGRPRSGALMSNLGAVPDVYDGDEYAQPVMNEKGRPRRAAAPTFGDKESETEQAAPAPLLAKKGPTIDRPANASDGSTEKPTRKRPTKGEGKQSRKAKGQPLAAAPVASPVKIDVPGQTNTCRKQQRSEEDVKKSEGPTWPAALNQGRQDALAMASDPGTPYVEETYLPQQLQTPLTGLNGESPRLISQSAARPRNSGGASSYWSVPEQNDFPKLLAHFGTDWNALSEHMKTKTPIMVSTSFVPLVRPFKYLVRGVGQTPPHYLVPSHRVLTLHY